MSSHDEQQRWWLYNAMEATRKCHIEAERRLLRNASLTNHANLYYGCWTAVLTLLTLDESYAYLAIPSACFASAVALWAAFATAEKFEMRARDFYESYTELQQLLGKFEHIEMLQDAEKRQRELMDLLAEYGRILRSTENHTEGDYASYVCGQYAGREARGDDANKIPLRIRWLYYWNRYISYVALRALIYLGIPLILLRSPDIISCLWHLG